MVQGWCCLGHCTHCVTSLLSTSSHACPFLIFFLSNILQYIVLVLHLVPVTLQKIREISLWEGKTLLVLEHRCLDQCKHFAQPRPALFPRSLPLFNLFLCSLATQLFVKYISPRSALTLLDVTDGLKAAFSCPQ